MKTKLTTYALTILFLLSMNLSAATCTGKADCKACKNCKHCAHCKAGGTCGVCKPSPKK